MERFQLYNQKTLKNTMLEDYIDWQTYNNNES